MIIQPTDDTKRGDGIKQLKDNINIQENFNRLVKPRNMNFNRDKWSILHLDRKHLRHGIGRP